MTEALARHGYRKERTRGKGRHCACGCASEQRAAVDGVCVCVWGGGGRGPVCRTAEPSRSFWSGVLGARSAEQRLPPRVSGLARLQQPLDGRGRGR